MSGEPDKVSVSPNGRISLNPQGHHVTGMAQGVGVGPFTFVSGQVALATDGTVVGVGNAAAQAAQCFKNLAEVLAQRGTPIDRIVKLTCYLTDLEHFPAYAAAKNSVFPDNPPASTTVIVSALLLPELLMEVEAIAHSDGD